MILVPIPPANILSKHLEEVLQLEKILELPIVHIEGFRCFIGNASTNIFTDGQEIFNIKKIADLSGIQIPKSSQGGDYKLRVNLNLINKVN
jgi:hypothetical protein